MREVSLKELVETGAYFGHQVKRWNPKIAHYLYGQREGIHIFDLSKTKVLLEDALKFVKKEAQEGKTFLFVGTKRQVKDKIKEVAQKTKSFFVNERFLGGTFTNFEQIKKTVKSLTDLKSSFEKKEFENRTKKEKLLIQRKIERMERFLGGLVGMEKLPDVLVIVDIKKEKTALKEAIEKNVKTVAVVDSNSDPTLVDYPIPMNDDSTKALDYVLDLIKDAILEGKSKK